MRHKRGRRRTAKTAVYRGFQEIHKRITVGFSLGLALLTVALLGPSAQANLIVDGGFETPVVGPGGFQSGFQTFTLGQTFGGTGNAWTVVGSNLGNVAVYPHAETIGNPAFALNVEEGSQALDLTGNTDNGAATGVSQSFATTQGSVYSLSFYVGELDDRAASVLVDLNGILFQTATNNSPTSGDTTLWQLFSYDFTATGDITTLSFINNTTAFLSGGPALNGLDDVLVSQTTPEPSSLVLLFVGLAMLGYAVQRRAQYQA